MDKVIANEQINYWAEKRPERNALFTKVGSTWQETSWKEYKEKVTVIDQKTDELESEIKEEYEQLKKDYEELK